MVQAASAEDVDKAVQAARNALKHRSWKLITGTERGRLLSRLADLIDERKELLASIDAWDNG
jgi:aldehyde dehydrogenase (NAD+)